MIAKVEPESGAATVVSKPQMKANPETVSAPPVQPGDPDDISIQIKKEEPEDTKTIILPAPDENEDIFGEVDGPEYVDLTYEGIAEVDGVEHFVCESMWP
jgi:hypothetical protein